MNDTLEVAAAFVVLAGFAAFCIFVTAQMVVGARTEVYCAAHGWPDEKVTWNFTRYCIKRIDQTDHIIPMLEAKP